jgi:hypothetical protein
MQTRSRTVTALGAVALWLAFAVVGSAAHDRHVLTNAVVHFGQPQPQDLPPVPGNPPPSTHFLLPDDVTIQKGGTVTFVVNGGGHGIAIHRVSNRTTREDIDEDLCHPEEPDRTTRAALFCNATTGTANLNYDITDGRRRLVIRSGPNPPPPAGQFPANPRVDDPHHSERLLATSGRVEACAAGGTAPDCDNTQSAPNPAGAFLVGTTQPTTTAPSVPGNRIQVQFEEEGRYLVICMNRAHMLNDHMFGFVTVVDDDRRGSGHEHHDD